MTKIRSKYFVLGPGAQKTFRLLSRTPRIPFNVLSRISGKLSHSCINKSMLIDQFLFILLTSLSEKLKKIYV